MRTAVIGTGRIVPESVEAMRTVGIDIPVIWGRNRKKAEDVAASLGIPEATDDYPVLLQRPDIDFVYIGLINSVHYAYAVQALESGKNVLVEKPLCTRLEDAAALADLARSRGLFLFETVSNIHLPAFRKVQEQLPAIGTLKLVQAGFSQYSSKYDAYLQGEVTSAFDPACEGGALRDLNVYNLHFVQRLFGAPSGVVFRANFGWNGIDTSGTALLSYDGFQAVCTAAKDSGSPSGILLQGDKGYIQVDGMPNVCPSVTLAVRGCAPVTCKPNHYQNRLCHMYGSFRDIYAARDHAAMESLLATSLSVLGTLAACL
ncbi:MAG: Gfo/Idh/MocA family oxidoreductase [Bacteroidales bacterium]|nr:Gfo/Idh/MocA family oxidoreductase [Bacteroidales bacterium]